MVDVGASPVAELKMTVEVPALIVVPLVLVEYAIAVDPDVALESDGIRGIREDQPRDEGFGILIENASDHTNTLCARASESKWKGAWGERLV